MNETEVPDVASLVELLDQLVVPTAPQAVSMMPHTVGWAVLGALLLALVLWRGWRSLRVYRANAYRRAALSELEAAGDNPAKLAEILRRAALVAYGRRNVAGLQGSAWIAFLERTGGEPWDETLGALLLNAPYRKQPRPAPELSKQVARWISKHSVGIVS